MAKPTERTQPDRAFSTPTRRQQIHVWIAAAEHEWLHALAQENAEPVSSTLRRLLRKARIESLASSETVGVVRSQR